MNNILKEKGIDLPSVEKVDNETNPLAIAHFSNDKWDWYVLGGKELSNGDASIFGLVNGYEKELGFFLLSEIIRNGAIFDDEFSPIGVFDIYEDFDLRY